LTGYVTPLDCLPIQDRERVLQGWSTSRIPLLRKLQASLTALTIAYWVRTSPTLGRVLGHPRVPAHGSPSKDGYPFRFIQFPPSASIEPEVITADAVIVGSGCGGAVAAKTLAEAGLKVIVVDKGYYWSPLRLPMSEQEGNAHLFENGGGIFSKNGTVTISSGSSWGGGGTVNWSASLQTQGYVRQEWSRKFGLKHFTSAEFQQDLDFVCARMGVGTDAIEHNKTNEVLLEGARKLGWSAKVVPQNTGGEAHNCGYCTLGCGSCGKKGPTETFLPDAAEAGALFIEGFECAEVLFTQSPSGKRIATGVRGLWTSRSNTGQTVGPDRATRPLHILAPRVILSTGSIATPLLLKRSGLTNPHIGRHLHLHPVSVLAAIWDEEVRPWEGPILTAVVNEFENLSGDGYGAKLEATTMLPSLFLPVFPWRSGAHAKEFCAKMKRATGYISLARDRYGGTVVPDPNNPARAQITYEPAASDRQNVLHGLLRLAELLYVAGAREIHSTLPALEPFIRPSPSASSKTTLHPIAAPSLNDPPFQSWLAQLEATGGPGRFASAHQMGSCRMGTSEGDGAVDEAGRVWGCEGLWVADGSVFPSASGVNPMITVMGIARGVGRGIVEEWLRERGAGSGEREKAKL
jgi:choline dehydrogenase-like flavoprotein